MATVFSSNKEAAEARTSDGFITMHVTLPDPDNLTPNSGFYARPLTIYLCSAGATTFVNASGLRLHAPIITGWGPAYKEGRDGVSFSQIPDIVVECMNTVISGMEPSSGIGGSVATVTDEPVAGEQRLTDLLATYEINGASVVIYWAMIEDELAGAFDLTEVPIFEGVVDNFSATMEMVTFDIVMDTQGLRSKVGRDVEATLFGRASFQAPVVFGNFDHDNGGYTKTDALKMGARGALCPAIPWKWDGSTDGLWDLIWNDFAGPNTGWTNQHDYGTGDGKPGSTDDVVLYSTDGNYFTILQDATAPPAQGQVSWIDNYTSTNTEAKLQIQDYVEGHSYILASSLESATAGFMLSDPERMVDHDPETYALFDHTLAAGSYANFYLPDTSGVGVIDADADNVIQAFIGCFAGGAMTAGFELYFGLYRIGTGAGWIGTQGTLTTTELNTNLVYKQTDKGGSVPRSHLIATNVGVQPLASWNWSHSDNSGNGGTVVFRIQIKTQGTGPTGFALKGGGFRVVSAVTKPGKNKRQILQPMKSRYWTYDRVLGEFDSPGALDQSTEYYVVPSKATLDDGSGTISGTAEKNLTHPCEIVPNLLLRWGKGITSSDMSFATSGFGAWRSIGTELNKWINNEVDGASGEVWDCIVRTSGYNVEEAVAVLCRETPLMIEHDPSDGTYYPAIYPQVIVPGLRYKDAAGSIVKFHPNKARDGAGLFGGVHSVDVDTLLIRSSSIDDVYNDVRVEFKKFLPTGEYLEAVHVNRSEYRVWDETSGGYQESGSSNVLGDALKDDWCGASYSLYGDRDNPTVLRMETIYSPIVATAFLAYFVRRNAFRRTTIEGHLMLDSYDLKPGHIIQFSNDLNGFFRLPEYGLTDWEDSSFLVTKVRLDPAPIGLLRVYFEAERIRL